MLYLEAVPFIWICSHRAMYILRVHLLVKVVRTYNKLFPQFIQSWFFLHCTSHCTELHIYSLQSCLMYGIFWTFVLRNICPFTQYLIQKYSCVDTEQTRRDRSERRGVPPLWLAVLADGHLVRGTHWFLRGRPTRVEEKHLKMPTLFAVVFICSMSFFLSCHLIYLL